MGSTATFDPYASDENFLLASFLFEDVGVTAYKSTTALLTSTLREAALASGDVTGEDFDRWVVPADMTHPSA